MLKWKSPFISQAVLRVVKKNLNNQKKYQKLAKIWSRNSVIPSGLIGKSVLVYSGNFFKKLSITREKIGYKFGEFCRTRTSPKGKSVKNIKNKSKLWGKKQS